MTTSNKGYTLVELLTAMAIYAILLVIVGFTVVTYSKLNKIVLNNNEYDEAIIMENYIIKLWKNYNGEITLEENSLLKINDRELIFLDNTLYFNELEIASHKNITKIDRSIEENTIIFKITINETTKPIVLFNLGGNN